MLARHCWFVWDVAMYPFCFISLIEAKGSFARTSLSVVFIAMVSIGLAGAHVQPVLEYF
jgi:hypothetical protein